MISSFIYFGLLKLQCQDYATNSSEKRNRTTSITTTVWYEYRETFRFKLVYGVFSLLFSGLSPPCILKPRREYLCLCMYACILI